MRDRERKDQDLAVLKALVEAGGVAGAARLRERLAAAGIRLQPRTIRGYLLELDRQGLTKLVSRRRGREITALGREELARADVARKVGFIASHVDELGYRMTHHKRHPDGTIITNISLLDASDLDQALAIIRLCFQRGLGMGDRLAVISEGEAFAGVRVPGGKTAVATVCSVTLNGILLQAGIPVTSRFGGLVEMRNGRPVRFVELIEYRGTTVDPLELFIQAGMTSVSLCARGASGLIGASFREIPAAALEDFRRIRRKMERDGLGGILAIGEPNLPLLEVPVAEGRAGMVVVGGLNPIAAAHEEGLEVAIHSLAGLAPFSRFDAYDAL